MTKCFQTRPMFDLLISYFLTLFCSITELMKLSINQ